jgi:hypothetical protein
MSRLIFVMLLFSVALCRGTAAQNVPILIYGGDDNRDFLGCINCSENDPASVWNEYSKYGWSNTMGVWSDLRPYKSTISAESACNQFATHPPVLVDRQGNFYGLLTINQFTPRSICAFSGNSQICTALKDMCDAE